MMFPAVLAEIVMRAEVDYRRERITSERRLSSRRATVHRLRDHLPGWGRRQSSHPQPLKPAVR